MMPRKPDYTLSVMDKESGKKLPNAGGAWKNEDGSLSISLNACVVLTSDKNLSIVLFPASTSPPSSSQKTGGSVKSPPKKQSSFGDYDEDTIHANDEIPF
jgi:hypothetical protein